MADYRTINDIVSNINQKLLDSFINYKPGANIIRTKGAEYVSRIEDYVRQDTFKTLTYTAVEELKPILRSDEDADRPSRFLLVDSLNIFYEFGYDKHDPAKKTEELKKLADLFKSSYPNTIIIFVCQKHNTFFKELKTIDSERFIYLDANEEVPSQSEIDDLLLIYLYCYLNVRRNVECYLLSFDQFHWFKNYTKYEQDKTLFYEQPTIYQKLQGEIDVYKKTRLNVNDLGSSYNYASYIMQNHSNFIKRMAQKRKASGKKTLKKAVKKTVKKAVKKTAKKPVKKTVKKAVKKTAKKAVKKNSKKSCKKTEKMKKI